MNILLVEDDQTIAEGLSYSLEQEDYTVLTVYNVKEAYQLLEHSTIHLALLDLSLPDGSGYDICKKIKQISDTPVIFLTACDDEVNVVMGLDLGADDYVTKPFRLRELISRIKSVLRRYEKNNPPANQKNNRNQIQIGSLIIRTEEAKIYKNQKEIILTALEYKLLLIFANHQGQVLTRNQLLEQIWDVSGDFVNDNTLTVYIKRLRDKLEDNPSSPIIIKTVRGLGYTLPVIPPIGANLRKKYIKKFTNTPFSCKIDFSN